MTPVQATRSYAERRRLLEEGQQDEEEDPEESHGMPVPGAAVDDDLSRLEQARGVEGTEGDDEGTDAEKKVGGVGVGDQIEKVA